MSVGKKIICRLAIVFCWLGRKNVGWKKTFVGWISFSFGKKMSVGIFVVGWQLFCPFGGKMSVGFFLSIGEKNLSVGKPISSVGLNFLTTGTTVLAFWPRAALGT